MELCQLVDAAKKWILVVENRYNSIISIERVKEDDTFLRYILESKHYLAELIIEDIGFHPYRFVSFIVLDKEQEPQQEPPYTFYDNESSSLNDIFQSLEDGILLITNQ